MANYSDMEDLIRIGAYTRGSDPKIDEAIFYHDKLEDFLRQYPNEKISLAEGYNMLKQILDGNNQQQDNNNQAQNK